MHALTGCDTVSLFCSIGKKTAWEVWKAFSEANEVCQRISHVPTEATDADMKVLAII